MSFDASYEKIVKEENCLLRLYSDDIVSRVYSSYVGKWRTVTEVYSRVYGKEEKNTGRISVATKILGEVGFLRFKKERGKKVFWRAGLEPLFKEFELRKISLFESEKRYLEQMLEFWSEENSFAEDNFGSEIDELRKKKPFIPSLIKIKTFLSLVSGLSLFYFAEEMSSSTQSMKAVLNEMKKKLKYVGKEEREGVKDKESKESTSISGKAIALMHYTRTQLENSIPSQDTLIYKIILSMNGKQVAEEIKKTILEKKDIKKFVSV